MTEWVQRDKQHVLQIDSFKLPRFLRWNIYYFLILIIYFFGNFASKYEFIYFQF